MIFLSLLFERSNTHNRPSTMSDHQVLIQFTNQDDTKHDSGYAVTLSESKVVTDQEAKEIAEKLLKLQELDRALLVKIYEGPNEGNHHAIFIALNQIKIIISADPKLVKAFLTLYPSGKSGSYPFYRCINDGDVN